jgi:hypothetical protein
MCAAIEQQRGCVFAANDVGWLEKRFTAKLKERVISCDGKSDEATLLGVFRRVRDEIRKDLSGFIAKVVWCDYFRLDLIPQYRVHTIKAAEEPDAHR